MTPEPPAPAPGSATRDYRRDSLAPFRPLMTDAGTEPPPPDPPRRPWLRWVAIAMVLWLLAALLVLLVVGIGMCLGIGA